MPWQKERRRYGDRERNAKEKGGTKRRVEEWTATRPAIAHNRSELTELPTSAALVTSASSPLQPAPLSLAEVSPRSACPKVRCHASADASDPFLAVYLVVSLFSSVACGVLVLLSGVRTPEVVVVDFVLPALGLGWPRTWLFLRLPGATAPLLQVSAVPSLPNALSEFLPFSAFRFPVFEPPATVYACFASLDHPDPSPSVVVLFLEVVSAFLSPASSPVPDDFVPAGLVSWPQPPFDFSSSPLQSLAVVGASFAVFPVLGLGTHPIDWACPMFVHTLAAAGCPQLDETRHSKRHCPEVVEVWASGPQPGDVFPC